MRRRTPQRSAMICRPGKREEDAVKGIVFVEFIGMVETRFSVEVADRIISASHLATGGAYDHQELIELVRRLSEETGIAAPELVKAFGEHLLTRFVLRFPAYFSG